jgi:hypothetical protein
MNTATAIMRLLLNWILWLLNKIIDIERTELCFLGV